MDYIDFKGEAFFKPSLKEFKERVLYNQEHIMSENHFDFYKYKFYDLKNEMPKNIHSDILSKSINDIRGAIPLGQLALYAHHGADAVAIENGKLIHTELKTVECDESKVVIGAENKFYYRMGKKLIPLERAMKIGFMITSDHVRQSKNRPTYLILRSKQTGKVIDAWSITGEMVMEQINKGSIENPSKTISLKLFLDYNKKEKVVIDHFGFENWKQILLEKGLYMIRTKNQEELKKEFTDERKTFHKSIAILRDEAKYWERKNGQTTRLLGRLDTLDSKVDKKIESISEQIEKLKERQNILEQNKTDIDKRRAHLEVISDSVETGRCVCAANINSEQVKIEVSKIKEIELLEATAALRNTLKLS